MQWLLRRFFDRLSARLMMLVSARIDSQIEIELQECRADILRAADDYEGKSFGGRESLAADLRVRAERVGQETKGAEHEVAALVDYLRTEDLRSETRDAPLNIPQELSAPRLGAPTQKRRGRPRKNAEE